MFYRKENDSIVYNGKGYLVYYVPEEYFASGCANVVGEYINLLGIFNYAIFDENGKSSGLKTFNFPSIFLAQPSEVERVKDVQLTKTSEKQDYRLLKFKNGDKLIVQVKVPQDIENVELFFKIFVITGKSPDTIPYPEVYKYFLDSMAANAGSYNVSNQLFGILQSEIYRDPTDKSRPFRISKAKKNKEWTNYINIPIKDVPDYISPFVSITSENFDDSLIQAILMDGKEVKSSPLERVLTGTKTK